MGGGCHVPKRPKTSVFFANFQGRTCKMGRFGTFGDILGRFGTFWDILGRFGTFGKWEVWGNLGTFVDVWGHLGPFGDKCGVVGAIINI